MPIYAGTVKVDNKNVYRSYGTTRSFFTKQYAIGITNVLKYNIETTYLDYNNYPIGLYSENNSGNTGVAYQDEYFNGISAYYAHNFIPFDDGTNKYRDVYKPEGDKLVLNKSERKITAYECWPETNWTEVKSKYSIK